MFVSKIKESPDNIYFNVSMTHTSDTGSRASRAYYIANKTIPLLDNADDYYLAVVSFSIPMDTIPIMLMPIIPGSGLNNTTPMIIGIRDFTTGNVYLQNLIFIPSNTELPPVDQTTTFQIEDPYYEVYTYDILISMFNVALQKAFNAYNLANPGNPHIAFPCPFFKYNSATGLMSLIAHRSWIVPQDFNPINNVANPPTQLIIMNQRAYNFIDSMPIRSYSPTIPNEGYDIGLQIIDYGSNGFPTNTYPTPSTYIEMTTNYSTMFLWASLKKITIRSNSIPINYEQTPSFDNLNPDQYSTVPIVADFAPANTNPGDTREIAYYFANYLRLIDLNQAGPLNRINFQIFWQDNQNNLYPLFISYFQNATIKFVFTKKSLYKNYHPK